METITELLSDHFILLLLTGAIFTLTGTIGAIKIRSIALDLGVYPRIALTVSGVVIMSVTISNPSLTEPSTDIRDTLLSSGGVYRFYGAEQNWVGEMIFEEGAREKVLVSMEVTKQLTTHGSGTASKTSARIPVIYTLTEGTVQWIEDRLHISGMTLSHHYFDTLEVEGILMEGMKIMGHHNVAFSAGELRPIVAYGGHVTYKNLDTNVTHRSFMVITKCEMGCED